MSLLTDVILILLFGLIAGWVAIRVHLPVAVGQVLLGGVIGPPLLGWIHKVSP
jgi:Kef-type K+ transport system membrane component KefB